MAAPAPSGERRPRQGPAPIASFDHDVSDESSPETKQTFQLPEIREDSTSAAGAAGGSLAAPTEGRARSHSAPGAGAAGLHTPAAPRIDISRASSSSHHDSRDSSPELALFSGSGAGGEGSEADEGARARLELGFREDGALDLRSSTEELAFLEGAPGGPPPPPPGLPPAAAAAASAPRRHSRKDSQGSEAALLGVSGRTSRLSSVGSQCSAQSALSHVSRLSVVSGVSRSPSPHKMLLETSFCGPKPIETDPEICAAAVEERLLEIAHMGSPPPPAPADARDRREVRTEATVEAPPPPAPAATAAPTAPAAPPPAAGEKQAKETRNRARAEERHARPRRRREPSQPEVYSSRNRAKDVIRIRLKPDEEYEGEEEEDSEHALAASGCDARKPATLELCTRPPGSRPEPVASPTPPRRTPSPGAPAAASRKSSFCSLFKSRETIASPDTPSEALRRKKSLTEGRSRSKSRERSAAPSSASKLRGSVLSLFKTPRRSGTSPSPSSRSASPVVQPAPPAHPALPARADKLKYYNEAKDGVIHIPLRTPPDEQPGARGERRSEPDTQVRLDEATPRPASAPQPRETPPEPDPPPPARAPLKPTQRTVLPDGSIIIPLHSPTEQSAACEALASSPLAARVGESPQLERDPPPQSSPAPVGEQEAPRAPSDDERAAAGAERPRRKERLLFSTHVGSTEQVFSTQFSITKTPSVSSEVSDSFPSFHEDFRSPPAAPASALRDTHITAAEPAQCVSAHSGAGSPHSARDSSESEASSGAAHSAPAPGGPGASAQEMAAAAARGGDAEARGLVVQESFEEELPYVPTTLPLERSLALPMVPVRDRAALQPTASVERPRAGGAPPAGPPRAPLPPPAPHSAPPIERIRIRLPRRPRPATTPARTAPPAPPAPPNRARTRSGSAAEDNGSEPRLKPEWIDFEEVPERRKQPKRIQTLPAEREAVPVPVAGGAVFSYVEPEECRCECHAHAPQATDPQAPTHSVGGGGGEGGEGGEGGHTRHIARPFTADLDLRYDAELAELPADAAAAGARRQ